jgi:tRNA (guanine37-N1)-methyltransferase
VWEDRPVPEVLLSGHHANIEEWRRKQSIKRTLLNRPDILEHAVLTEKEKAYIHLLKSQQ